MGQLGVKSVQTIVKVMVADGRCIVAQHTHQFKFQFPTIKIKIGGTLEDIARIKKEGIWILASYLFHQSGPPRNPAQVWILCMVHGKGINMAVNVIGMQYGDMFFTSPKTRTQRQTAQPHQC